MIRFLARLVGKLLRRQRAGVDLRVAEDPRFAYVPRPIALRSPAFTDGAPLPPGPHSPPLTWSGIPREAVQLALVVEDVDVPLPRPFAHAIAYPIPPNVTTLAAGAVARYGSPSPLPGHGPHRYIFTLLALDFAPRFERAPTKRELLDTVAGRVLALGELTGTAER